MTEALRRRFCSSLALGALSWSVCPGASAQSGPAASTSSTNSTDPTNPTNPTKPAVVTAGANPTAPAKPINLKYDGYLITGFGSSRIASARLKFEPGNGVYQMQLRVESMLADLLYESRGRLTERGLQPEIYIERRKMPFRRERIKKVRYVVAANRAAAGSLKPGDLVVPPNHQDRLSLMIQFSLMARANPKLLSSGQEISMPFARISAVSDSRWRASPPKPVRLDGASEVDNDSSVAAGTVSRLAQRVARVADKKESVDVAFWLAADESRLPLILQFSENGRSLRFVWRG